MAILEKLKKTSKSAEVATEKKTGVKNEKKSENYEKTKTKEVTFGIVRAGKILVKPLITEKSAKGEANGEYSFAVSLSANKSEIKEAVKHLYGIMPESVRTMNFDGKIKRSGKIYGRRKDWKKAVVKLPKGKNISIHEGI